MAYWQYRPSCKQELAGTGCKSDRDVLRSEQAGEACHKVDAAGLLDLRCERADLGRFLDEANLVAHPVIGSQYESRGKSDRN